MNRMNDISLIAFQLELEKIAFRRRVVQTVDDAAVRVRRRLGRKASDKTKARLRSVENFIVGGAQGALYPIFSAKHIGKGIRHKFGIRDRRGGRVIATDPPSFLAGQAAGIAPYLAAAGAATVKLKDKTSGYDGRKAPKFKLLKKHEVPLSPEERAEVMKRKATWRFNGKSPSPAVWKSVLPDGKTWFTTHTHRAYNSRPTLAGAISRYHKFIKGTA